MWTSWSKSVKEYWSCCHKWRESNSKSTSDKNTGREYWRRVTIGNQAGGIKFNFRRDRRTKEISLEMEEHLFNRNNGSWKLRSCKAWNKLIWWNIFKEPHRRIPSALFQEIREHLKEMLEAGAIRPSTSPFSFNVAVVRKKDGSIRFCVDFRKLNSKTIKDAYAIPRVEDTLHLLAGTKYLTKLDLRSSYWQIKKQKWDPLSAMKTFIRKQMGHTT